MPKEINESILNEEILEDMKKKGATVRETETNIKIFYRLIHCFRFR